MFVFVFCVFVRVEIYVCVLEYTFVCWNIYSLLVLLLPFYCSLIISLDLAPARVNVMQSIIVSIFEKKLRDFVEGTQIDQDLKKSETFLLFGTEVCRYGCTRKPLSTAPMTSLSTAPMTSLSPILCRHYPRSYDVTIPDPMTSLSPIL